MIKFKSTPEQLDFLQFNPNTPNYAARTDLNLRINQLEKQNKFLELIGSLQPELKQIANQYLEQGLLPSIVLYRVAVIYWNNGLKKILIQNLIYKLYVKIYKLTRCFDFTT